MRTHALGRLAFTLGLAGVLVAGCSPQPQGGREAGPQPAASAGISGPGATAAPAVVLDRAATVRLGQISAPPGGWDPIELRNAGETAYHTLVYDRLVGLKPDLSLDAMLATSWKSSSDGKALDMQLRQGVKFQDGTAFDAKAAKANLDRAKTAQASTLRAALGILESVEIVNEHAIRLQFAAAAYTFPYVLATERGVSMMVSPAAFDSPQLKTAPVGSGPYKMVSRAQDRVAYERWDGYWDPDAAKAAKLEIVSIVDDNARLNALRSGQLDVVNVRNSQYPEVKALADGKQFKLHSSPKAVEALYINTKTPGLDKVDVRRALSLAIDRKTINERLLNGQCPPTVQPFPPNTLGYDPALDATPMYDPARAKQLLASAGVTGLSMRMILRGFQPQDGITEALQGQFAEVGVKVTFTRTTPAESTPMWSRGEADGFVSNQFAADSSVAVTTFLLGSTYQVGGQPKELVDLAREANSLPLESPQRTAAYQKISRWHVENPTHIYLCADPVLWLAKADVLNVEQMPYSQVVAVLDPRGVGRAKN